MIVYPLTVLLDQCNLFIIGINAILCRLCNLFILAEQREIIEIKFFQGKRMEILVDTITISFTGITYLIDFINKDIPLPYLGRVSLGVFSKDNRHTACHNEDNENIREFVVHQGRLQ